MVTILQRRSKLEADHTLFYSSQTGETETTSIKLLQWSPGPNGKLCLKLHSWQLLDFLLSLIPREGTIY